jgi:hypothetical protein
VITGATLFGLTVRGSSSRVSGVDNVISGTGFRPVDARADAPAPALAGTDTDGWQSHLKLTPLNYLQFHPLAALWLSILVLLLAGALWSRRKALPAHPYAAGTRWQPVPATGPPPSIALGAASEQVAGRAAAWPAAPPWPSAPRPATVPGELAESARTRAARAQNARARAVRPEPGARPLPAVTPAAREPTPRPPRLVGAAVGLSAERDRDQQAGGLRRPASRNLRAARRPRGRGSGRDPPVAKDQVSCHEPQ